MMLSDWKWLSGVMRVSVVHPAELSESDVAAWRRFQQGDPSLANPFLSPEFTRLVATVRSDVAVAAIEDGNALSGFFPFQRRGGIGLPVGGGLSDCQAVIAAPGWECDARALVRAAGLSFYEFSNVRASQRLFVPFHRTVSASPLLILGEGGFDAYARALRDAGGNAVTRTQANARRLERRLGPLRFAMHDADPNSLRHLIDWKRQQYLRTGGMDVFSRPWTVELLERIHATQSEEFAGVLSTLWAGDSLVAAHMGMRSATVLHHWFPAYDRTHSQLAPGRVLLLDMIRGARAAGIRTIEFGVGGEDYKNRFANGEILVADGLVGSVSVPLLRRRLWDGAERIAYRVLRGNASQRAADLFFRARWERNHR